MNQQCKVCGEPAAGFHFGAFTCEGCKSFFGRTNNNQSAISECKNNGECVINKKNRTSCKACRLKKCLMVGMSKSSSRYGRRSNWFKIHCLMEEQNNQNNLNNLNNLNLNNLSALSGLSGSPAAAAAAAAAAAGAAAPGAGAAAAFFGGGAGIYPTHLLHSHFLSPERLLASNLNGQVKRRKASGGGDDSGRHSRSSAEDSAGSSAGETPMADEDSGSRPASALSFLRPPSSQQSPSPFSEKDFYQTQRRLSATVTLALPASPVGGQTTPTPPALAAAAAAAFGSPLFGPYAPAPARFLYPAGAAAAAAAAAAARPGVAPAQTGLLYSPVPVRAGAGGDLLLCSPALGGVAVEQDQPIDLSVKSTLTRVRCAPETRSPSPPSPGDAACADACGPCADAPAKAACPLDLTKRATEVPQSG